MKVSKPGFALVDGRIARTGSTDRMNRLFSSERNVPSTLLKFNETKIMALRVGTGLPNIQKPSLVKYVLLISSDESEQQKIADFLSILDVRLEQLSKVELLKEQKKGLMQQMFM